MSNWASTGIDAIKRQFDGLTPEELEGPIRAAIDKAESELSLRRLHAILKEVEAQKELNRKKTR